MIISIDGASKDNGKPDCLAVGAAVILNKGNDMICFGTEKNSTNQRGELIGLIKGLEGGLDLQEKTGYTGTIYVLTDSEYIANCLNKEWYVGWQIKGWKTADGEPVKNRDLWEKVIALVDSLKERGDESFVVYSIKGHLLSMGHITSMSFIERVMKQDNTVDQLYIAFNQLYIAFNSLYGEALNCPKKSLKFAEARKLFIDRNGAEPPEDIFRKFVVLNNVTDALAVWRKEKEVTGSH